MPIYTGTGDKGFTGLFNNQRVPKEDLRIECYGIVDEVNAFLGVLRAEPLPRDLDARLQKIQSNLFDLGAELATPTRTEPSPVLIAAVDELESWIDESEGQLPQLTSFILPGGHREAALLHVARTVSRRAERCFWELQHRDKVPDIGGVYLNRLSDLFFSWARLANQRNKVEDVPWTSSKDA